MLTGLPKSDVALLSYLSTFQFCYGKPYDWQKKILLEFDGSENLKDLLLLVSRQCGKSSLSGTIIARAMLLQDGLQVAVVTPSEDQSIKSARQVIEPLEKLTGKLITNKMKFSLENGSHLEAFPNNEETIRGMTADILFFDEAAYIPEEIFSAAMPFVFATNGVIFMASTPKGVHGTFYRSVLQAERGEAGNNLVYSGRVLYSQIPEITKEAIEKQKKSLLQEDFAREFELCFTTENQFLFDPAKAMQLPKDQINWRSMRLAMYCDPAAAVVPKASGDSTVIAIAGMDGAGKVYHIDLVVAKGLDTTWLKGIWKRLYDIYRPSVVGFESNGFQYEIYRQLHELVPATIPVENTKSKYARAMAYAIAWQNNGIIWLLDNQDLYAQAIDQHKNFPNGSHDDIVDAFSGTFNLLSQYQSKDNTGFIIGQERRFNLK